MIYQTITVSVCSSLWHDKITWLRFENESDTWYYSLLFWNILFHAILKIWYWYFDISIYHFFKLMIMIVTITEFARENYWATIMIISYDNDSLHIMMKMISRYYHSVITKISIKYQNSNSQSNDILSRYFYRPQYCTLVKGDVQGKGARFRGQSGW